MALEQRGWHVSDARRIRYTPTETDDLGVIYPRANPSDSYPQKNGPRYVVRFAPPVLLAKQPDLRFTRGSEAKPVETGSRFGGGGLSFAIQTPLSGLTMNATTGVIQVDTNDEIAGDVTVIASNSGGSASVTFRLEVTA